MFALLYIAIISSTFCEAYNGKPYELSIPAPTNADVALTKCLRVKFSFLIGGK